MASIDHPTAPKARRQIANLRQYEACKEDGEHGGQHRPAACVPTPKRRSGRLASRIDPTPSPCCPVRASGGGGTMPVRRIQSRAAHLACAVTGYLPYPESPAAASDTAGT
jgi:hypothetical protein